MASETGPQPTNLLANSTGPNSAQTVKNRSSPSTDSNSVKVRFLPDNVTTTAFPGEPLLEVAARAGVYISTGCLMGSCHACEVDVLGEEEPILACLSAVPSGVKIFEINLLCDPTW